jgi:hypothetical protein
MAKKPGFVQLHEPQNDQPLELLTRGGQPFKTPRSMPGKVKILGQHFKVAYHSQIYTLEHQRLRGIVIFAQRLIVIDPKQSIHQMRETLFHEMAHVYLYAWQEKSKVLSKLTNAQVEEVCDLFAEAHYDARLNNSLS